MTYLTERDYWDCEFADYDSMWDPDTGETNPFYGCDNKERGDSYCDGVEDCKFYKDSREKNK